jgi:hypothetical protein
MVKGNFDPQCVEGFSHIQGDGNCLLLLKSSAIVRRRDRYIVDLEWPSIDIALM